MQVYIHLLTQDRRQYLGMPLQSDAGVYTPTDAGQAPVLTHAYSWVNTGIKAWLLLDNHKY